MRPFVATAVVLGLLPLASCGSAPQVAAPAAAAHRVAVGGPAPALHRPRTGDGDRARDLPARRRTGRRRPRRCCGSAATACSSRHCACTTRAPRGLPALHQLFLPHYHVVRLRVLAGSRSLVDVGGRFVSAGAQRELRTADGRPLGRLEASIQDVIGFVKLVHRRSGAQAVVRGNHGHVGSCWDRRRGPSCRPRVASGSADAPTRCARSAKWASPASRCGSGSWLLPLI